MTGAGREPAGVSRSSLGPPSPDLENATLLHVAGFGNTLPRIFVMPLFRTGIPLPRHRIDASRVGQAGEGVDWINSVDALLESGHRPYLP